MSKLILSILFSLSAFGATGSWNGVAFTAWNGVAQTAWNGTGVSCAGGSCGVFATEDGPSRWAAINGADGDWPGQLWSDGSARTVCKVSIEMWAVVGNISAKTYKVLIYSTSGSGASTALNTLLGTSAAVTGNNAWNSTFVDFTFSSPVSLSASTTYAIVATCDQGDDASNYASAIYNTSGSLAGNVSVWTEAGVNYGYNTAAWDLSMKIWTQ